jgi:hypothetical protein
MGADRVRKRVAQYEDHISTLTRFLNDLATSTEQHS